MRSDVVSWAEKYQQILDGLSTAVMLFNQDLELSLINPAGEMLFQSSYKHLRGTHLATLFPSIQDLASRAEEAFSSNQAFAEREIVIHTPMSGEITVDCMVTPLLEGTHLEGNNASSLLLELNRVDRNLRISREETQLTQSNAIRALIRGMAHEIKNPLGGLRGAAQLLERELETPALKEYTHIIIGEADRLRNLVNRLLGPNTMPQKQWLNIHEVVERVRQIVAADKPPGVIIHKDYDPSIPDLFIDKDQLIQALLNIMGNAAQALGNSGEITLMTRTVRQFTIGAIRHKLACQVCVIDNGPGIPGDIQESIFFPMVTTRAEGSGLGLPIAQSLVQQHGGLIDCISKPGRTVFRISIPIS